MSEHRPFDISRVSISYDVLKKEGIVSRDDDATDEEKIAQAERVVLDIHATAESAEAPDESARNTRIKKALASRAYLLPYYENAPIEILRKIMHENGWSTGQNVDVRASKSVKFYADMLKLPRQADHELSEGAIADAEKFRLQPAVELDYGPPIDLDDTVRMLGTTPGRLSSKYAQGLLVAYGKVHSTYDPRVVANTVALALEDVLRRHKFHFGDSDTVIRRFSDAYLYGLEADMDAPNFERLTKYSWQMAAKNLLDDGSMQPQLESTLARQLQAMYPAPAVRKK